MRRCGFNTGPDFHLLDHIGPLSFYLKMPLFIEEEKNFTLFKHYYPMVESVYFPDIEFHLSFFAQNFDELYECKFWVPHLKQLFLNLYQKNMHLVFCAHGQSDKIFGLHPYATQDTCLIYGTLLKKMLDDLGIQANCKFTGNYRLAFYLEHKNFYDAVAQKEIFSRFPKKQRTILYAPTWNDADEATSFFHYAELLCRSLPESFNLIVKVHPLLEQRDPSQYYRIAHLIEQKPNRILVSEFPPVYPLLAGADVYLGDYSSVGYDFLYFQKPMFFLLRSKNQKLHECGSVLEKVEDLFKETENQFLQQQKNLYKQAFIQSGEEEQKEFLNHLLCPQMEELKFHKNSHPTSADSHL